MTDRTAPRSQLRLEWVYGYRGHQCRNNLYYTANSEIVYFVAGVGVVYNTRENTQRFFLGHDDDIISLALHPEKLLVATGQVGKEPYICVWDSSTTATVSILKDAHQRGVTCLAFNNAGNQLVSVGLEDYHMVVVWDWKKGKILASTRGHTDRIFDIQFNPYNDSSIVSCGVKHIKFWTMCGNALSPKKGIFGKAGEIQTNLCLAFGPNDVTYSGTLSGEIYKWKGQNLAGSIPSAHMGAVFSIYGGSDGYATGSKDGTFILWDPDFKPIAKIDMVNTIVGYEGLSIRSVCWQADKILVGTNAGEVFEVLATDKEKPRTIVQGHAEGELWALAVHPKKGVFATGSDDKTVRLWSMADKSLLARTDLDQKIRSVSFSADATHLAVGLGDGSFRVLKARDLSEIAHIRDRREVLHEMKYSPDGQYLAVGSNDNFVDIYAVAQKYKKVGECKGSSSFITHLDWSEDSKYLQTNSGAAERLFYRMPNGKRITNKDEIKGINWASWTCVLGTEVNGIWGKYTDTNDVNATDASFNHNVLVTGDDFGLVKLFNFPSVRKGAKFRKYVGHSAHVTNVRFSHDYHRVISVGGGDHAVFQWRFLPEGVAGDDEDLPEPVSGYLESDSEESDSEASDIGELDSDVENEKQIDYDRTIYKEDLPALKRQLSKKRKSRAEPEDNNPRQKPPNEGLRLEFVFGYRGYDCRNNVFYTQTGEIVYHVAALGIVYNRDKHKQRFYTGHTDDILCLSIHPVKDFIATGQVGRDPTIHVWDAEKMETLSILKGQHARGVCAVDFSGDGRKLASVGLDDNHVIVVWDWKKGEKLATTRGHKDKIFVIKWNPMNNEQLVTAGVKHIKFWTQTGGGFTSKRGTFGHAGKHDSMMCVTYGKNPEVVFSGGALGKVYIWQGNALQGSIQAHEGPVFAIQTLEKGFVTGGKDGNVCLWDDNFSRCLKQYKVSRTGLDPGQPGTLIADAPAIRAITLGQGRILVGTKNSEILEIDKAGPIHIILQGHLEGELWGLANHPTDDVSATVSDDCTVRVWDMANYRLQNVRKLKQPARSVTFSPDGRALAVGMKDGSFKVLDSSTLEDMVEFHHRKEEISDLKFSPGQGKYLAVASHDNFVDIYNVMNSKRVGICKGSSSYVTHVDWDEKGKLLQTNSGAKERLFFEAPRGNRQAIVSTELQKIDWCTWTGVLGDNCTGIWPPHSDITDVNATDRSKDKRLLATGDDFGFVKVFEYPVKGKNAKFKKYVGHSAHVTNVRWSHDDCRLVSAGGADTAVMVWSRGRPADREETGGDSDDSDTDSEEEGYDSDVEREKNMNYADKIYTNPLRTTKGVKPHLREGAGVEEHRPAVSRGSTAPPKVRHVDRQREQSRRRRQHPIQDLTLEFIHGYRGFDTRDNLHYLPDGDIVYHAAGACIVLSTANGVQSFYLEHTDDIICLSVNQHPKYKNIVATGQIGNDPCVHVWDAETKDTLSIIQGFHGVGVCAVDFSCNGKLLLTVGLEDSHGVAVWKWTDGSKLASSEGHTERIFVAQFRPDSDSHFVTCGVKHVKFWTLAGGELIGKRGIIPTGQNGASEEQTKLQTMLSVAFGANNLTFTGAMSGDVYVWSGHKLARVVSKAHNGPVFTMYTTLKDGLIVTGGKEKKNKDNGAPIKLWDGEMKRCKPFTLGNGSSQNVVKSVCRAKGKILVGTKDSDVIEITEKTASAQTLIRAHGEGEIWGLACHPEKEIFVTASDDQTVRLWDITSKAMLAKTNVGMAARSATFSTDGEMLAVGLKNGTLLLMKTSDLKIITQKRDRRGAISDVRFSPDNKYLAVGSEDKCVDLYEIREGHPIKRAGYCKGIPSFVTQMDFSADGRFIQVSTGAYERLVFSVPDGNQLKDTKQINRITWATWTSVLGNEVIGIWPRNADKADVNCADLCKAGVSLATGDDFGFVKLFDFPATEKYATHKKYVGHSAHVTNVRFTCDDRYLISAGGDDCCVFVWKCI